LHTAHDAAGAMRDLKMSFKIKYLIIPLLLAGCKEVPLLPTLTPHKMDIRQGNYVTQEMVDKLKPGMTQKEVRFHLGTPLIVDPFRTDRWDYVYTYKHKGDLVEQRRLAVIFKDEKLVRLDGDVVPAKPKPEPVVAEKPKPEPAAADKPKPDALQAKPASSPAPAAATPAAPAALTTTDGKPVASAASEPSKPVAATPDTAATKPPAEKPAEERGFFGRLLDSIGF